MPILTKEILDNLQRRVASKDQLAKIDTFTINNGPGSGGRYLSVRCLSGMRLRVALDRGFDIDELEFAGQQLGWHGPSGHVAPAVTTADQEAGTGLLRAFSGFMVTCGYDYFGGGRTGSASHFGYALRELQHYPLHGRATFLRSNLLEARIDWTHSNGPVVRLVADMRQAGLFGENLCCTRNITIPVGDGQILIEDGVRNEGMTKAPHMILYHLNLGYPLIGNGTVIEGLPADDAMPSKLPDLTQPQSEAFRFLPRSDCATAIKVIGAGGYSLSIEPLSSSFRYIGQWWNHYDGMECIGIEPASSLMPGLDGGEWTPEHWLEPGDAEHYRLRLSISTC